MYYIGEKEKDGMYPIWFGIGNEDPNREVSCYAVNLEKAGEVLDMLTTAQRIKNGYAEVIWSPADIEQITTLSQEDAKDWLESNQNVVRNRITELGWEVLHDYLSFDGIEARKEE